jgi:hypothetical protein
MGAQMNPADMLFAKYRDRPFSAASLKSIIAKSMAGAPDRECWRKRQALIRDGHIEKCMIDQFGAEYFRLTSKAVNARRAAQVAA